NVRIRFRASMSGSDEDANVDNVRLVANGAAALMTMGVASANSLDTAASDGPVIILPDAAVPVSLVARFTAGDSERTRLREFV
ncbi:MAG: hypothetical protein AB7U20_19395, partial [Planctomycetaceae bacterium]